MSVCESNVLELRLTWTYWLRKNIRMFDDIEDVNYLFRLFFFPIILDSLTIHFDHLFDFLNHPIMDLHHHE